jgi:SNF2 family DNA or RNA helicase
VDEGTKIKNLDSQTSQAIQGMRAPHRLLLTGTPVKNYIPDMFALMWWAMGNNSPRFPFDRNGGRAKFEKEYCVIEYTIDRKKGDKKLSRKVLPQVSNLISFWRLANAGCIRRTKANAGVPIVPVVWHHLRAPFGKQQAAAYAHWLNHFADWFIEKHPDEPISDYPKLIERSAAILGLFAKLQFMCTLPEAEPDRWADRSVGPVSNFTPKNVAVIHKVAELLAQGRKVVVFSAVKDHSLWLADVLNRLGYPALSVVEQRGDEAVTLGPKGRADLVRDFIQDGYPILCASIHAMNLGHNLDCASAVIVNGLPWDFATFDQAINRVHRITSKRPVDVFVAQTVCREDTDDFRMGASLDQKMRALLRDKGQASSLALDGVLPERCETTINIQALLDYLAKHWQKPTDTPDEEDLRRCLLADQFPLNPEP